MRSTIGLVGGYWRPSAAVARLLEELGELAELDRNDPRYASELADLWIITTALSDQFLGAVAEPGLSTCPVGEGRRDILGDSLSLRPGGSRGSSITTTVPRSRATSTVGSRSATPSPSSSSSLAEVARAHDVDLAEAVDAKLDAIPALDSGRFASGVHDPSTAAVER